MSALPTIENVASAGERSATEQDKNCMPVKREIYRLRHWQWSGISPFEGGFLPDPHFVCSSKSNFPPSVAELLPEHSEFQIVDVNPFFKDKSKEIILVIQTSNKILYEFKLDYLHNFNIRQAVAEAYPDIKVFRYQGKIAILAQLDSELRGYYFISLPLNSGEILQFHPIGSTEFINAGEYFRNLPQSKELKEYFCGRGVYDGTGKNAFIAYYQKFRGDCDHKDQDPRNQTNYEYWWAQEQR